MPTWPIGRGRPPACVSRRWSPIRTKTGTPAPGLDPRAGRMPFTVAPSVHRRGGAYRWVVPPWDLEPPTAPAWLLDQLAPPVTAQRPARLPVLTEGRARHVLMRSERAILDAPPGQRNA